MVYFSSYEHAEILESLWKQALDLYKQANHNLGSYFKIDQLDYLKNIGIGSHDIYDSVEDFSRYGEPSFSTFLLVSSVRTEYFYKEQGGVASSIKLQAEELPAKTESYQNIIWLPRILKKAEAKLKGELAEAIMYGCSADRLFLKEYGIHPADFLKLVWAMHFDIAQVHSFILSKKN